MCSYYDSAESVKISKERAKWEIEVKHKGSEPFETFLKEVGDKEEYDAQEVLRWLGY